MPYIITTKRAIASWPSHQDYLTISRRAVATLEEARETIASFVPAEVGLMELPISFAIPESGGTIGPLPDGTLISVQRVPYNQLRLESGWTPAPDDEDYSSAHRHGAEVIDAFNATVGN